MSLTDIDDALAYIEIHKNKPATSIARIRNINNWLFPFLLKFNKPPSFINSQLSKTQLDINIARILYWRYTEMRCSASTISTLFYSIKMYYSLSTRYRCIITDKITSFKYCYSIIEMINKNRTDAPGSIAITYDVLTKMVNYINKSPSYTPYERCTLCALFCFMAEGGNRGSEIFGLAVRSNFKQYTPTTITYLYNTSKTNSQAFLQCSPVRCICSTHPTICAYHRLLKLFTQYHFECDEYVFQYCGKDLNARTTRTIESDILRNIGINPTKFSLHAFRKTSAQYKAMNNYNIQQLCLQHNWKSIASAKPYFDRMHPQLKTKYIINQ